MSLLGDLTGKTAIDLCAAPGGKTMQLAGAGHRVTSVDSSESRLERLRENLGRTRLTADLVHEDAMAWEPGRLFDAILLDAPCSATGTFRRHPEVLYRARPRVIADNGELQTRLLARSAAWLKPGGALVYATCSILRREGAEQAGNFLGRHSSWIRQDVSFDGGRADGPGRLLTPAHDATDGFFVARFVSPC